MSKRKSSRKEINPSADSRHLFNFLMVRGGYQAAFDVDDLRRLTAERVATGHLTDSKLVVELLEEHWVHPDGTGGLKLALN